MKELTEKQKRAIERSRRARQIVDILKSYPLKETSDVSISSEILIVENYYHKYEGVRV